MFTQRRYKLNCEPWTNKLSICEEKIGRTEESLVDWVRMFCVDVATLTGAQGEELRSYYDMRESRQNLLSIVRS